MEELLVVFSKIFSFWLKDRIICEGTTVGPQIELDTRISHRNQVHQMRKFERTLLTLSNRKCCKQRKMWHKQCMEWKIHRITLIQLTERKCLRSRILSALRRDQPCRGNASPNWSEQGRSCCICTWNHQLQLIIRISLSPDRALPTKWTQSCFSTVVPSRVCLVKQASLGLLFVLKCKGLCRSQSFWLPWAGLPVTSAMLNFKAKHTNHKLFVSTKPPAAFLGAL